MCEHEWRGDAEGVTCIKCGKHLTASEYKESLETKEPASAEEKPKRGRKAKHE